MNYLDLVRMLYEEHATQARQHEDQRTSMTAVVLTIAGLLVGVITYSELAMWSLPASLGLIVLGCFGSAFSRKLYERNRFHTCVLKECREEIVARLADPSVPATKNAEAAETEEPKTGERNTEQIRTAAENRHAENFPSSRSAPVRTFEGLWWCLGLTADRLHVFWERLHGGIAAIGVVLAAITYFQWVYTSTATGSAKSIEIDALGAEVVIDGSGLRLETGDVSGEPAKISIDAD